MVYVYPVISRRAKGLSIGINLSVNNTCNWSCVYCQVPELSRGVPPPVDFEMLERELRSLLHEVTDGHFMEQNVPEEYRRLVDIAFSGNGEPTNSKDFPRAVECAFRVLQEFGLLDSVKVRLITNGSFMHRETTRQGITLIGQQNGEVWFKVDRCTEAGIKRVHRVRMNPEQVKKSLLVCCNHAPTWIQTCCFFYDGKAPDQHEVQAYLVFLEDVKDKIKGVHLYGIARLSMRPEAKRLSLAPKDNVLKFAQLISSAGVKVVVNA